MNRTKMKRKYSVLAATITALLLALISTPAHASVLPDGTYLCTTGVASSSTPNFRISSDVVSSGTSCSGAVVIPAGVTSIGPAAFQSATLTSITIPASVTSIGANAFIRATGLTSITFAAGSVLTSIRANAFNGATRLTSITIPASVTSIDQAAFYGVTSLTSITIPAGVTTIGNRAFLGTTSLTSITFAAGSGLTSIGTNAFEGATALTSITIPSGVTTIGSFAFTGTTSITSITIPVGVTTIQDFTFFGATSLASVYFLSNAPLPVGVLAFNNVAAGAKAYIKTGATGFGTIGGLWNNLIVDYCLTAAGSSAASIVNAYRADKLADVYFSPLSSKLSKAAKKQLEVAVIANPSAVYKVTGYVQKSIFAKNAKNDSSLSLARAKAIETHLESLGAGVTFTVVVNGAGVPANNGKSNKARRAALYAMTPVVQ